jgi:magnesium-transporting ATPase (P-type)
MEINGLPLHPLVVHAAVIFGPIAALVALAYLVPRWRLKLRWPMVGLAVIATLSIVAAYLTGNNFLEHKPELRTSPQVQTHQDRARQLLWVTIAFGVIALASGWFATRTGALRIVLDVLLGAAAIATLVLVFLTGEAGARAVWG